MTLARESLRPTFILTTSAHQLTIGRETFSGTVTDGPTSVPLAAVNEVVWPDSTSQCNQAVGTPGLVLETPAWGPPPDTLTSGQQVTLSATGITPTGDDLAPLSVPIADPASHVWSSSDHAVASITPDTGVVSAHRPGTATISVTSGGITATTTVTVVAGS